MLYKYSKRTRNFLGRFLKFILCNISNTKDSVDHIFNTTRSGVFLTNFEVFGNVVKHCLERLIYVLEQS